MIAFMRGIRMPLSTTAEYDLYPGVVQDGVEQGGERPVAVLDQELRPAVGVLEVHRRQRDDARRRPVGETQEVGVGIVCGAFSVQSVGVLDETENLLLVPGDHAVDLGTRDHRKGRDWAHLRVLTGQFGRAVGLRLC
jgi:hypothetical protein